MIFTFHRGSYTIFKTVRHSISPYRHDHLHVGQRIPLWYVPAEPKIFRPDWERAEQLEID